MKELKKQIAELLHQKLSIYGFKKKGQWEYERCNSSQFDILDHL